MKHLKSFNENLKLDIDSICNKYGIKNYTINQDGTIDVDAAIGECGAIGESGVGSEAFELSWQFRTCSNNSTNPGP